MRCLPACRRYGLYAARALREGEVAVAYEEREHVIVTKGHVERAWPKGGTRAQWFRSYAYPLTEEVRAVTLWKSSSMSGRCSG